MIRKIWLSLFSVVVLLGLVACNDDNNNQNDTNESSATPVEIADIEKGNLTAEHSFFGRVEPSQKTPVLVEEPGEIKELKVTNGKKVKKDDVLATVKTAAGDQDIKAKEDGQIANLKASVGDKQSDEDPLMVILDTDKLKAEINVTEDARDSFSEDDKVKITHKGKEYEGKVTNMDIVPDDTGLFPIEIEVKNDNNKILSGAVVELIQEEVLKKDTLKVPTEAIVNELDKNYLFLVENDQVKKVEIDVKETQSKETAIKGEVEKDDQVVVKGQYTLEDGDQIEIKKGNES